VLPKIEDEYGYTIMPYLDCGLNVKDHGSHLEITCNGNFSASSTLGTLGLSCIGCGESQNEDDMYYSEYYEDDMCETCYGDCHVYIEGTTYHVDSSDIVNSGDGYWILSEEAVFSNQDSEYYHQDDMVFCEYINDFIKKSDSVVAITDEYYLEGQVCSKDDCEVMDCGRWYHTDLADAIKEQQKQLELELC
jgi:hypothetical protein